jgi:LDH2 family malate/lactate/ureidoglycolate dehydrogenase
MLIDVGRLRMMIADVLIGNGAGVDDAQCQADILIEGELREQPSHGVGRLPVLVGRLRRGLIVSGATITPRWLTEAVVAIDGGRSFGPVAARGAIDAVIDRAGTSGVAIALVNNSNHIGMLAPYVERIAADSAIGLAFTTSEALVHPWGGTAPMVGTNPIAIAVPTTEAPLVLDMSTAAVSMGKVLDHAARDLKVPLGWGVDADGRPTTDASALASGALAPFGGSKGYALAIALECLVGVLTGSALGPDVRGTLDAEFPATKGDVFMAIRLDRLGLTEMLPRVSAYLDLVRASGRRGAVSIPGDRARATRMRRATEGIPLSSRTWSALLDLHREVAHA